MRRHSTPTATTSISRRIISKLGGHTSLVLPEPMCGSGLATCPRPRAISCGKNTNQSWRFQQGFFSTAQAATHETMRSAHRRGSLTTRPIIVLPPALAGFIKLPRWVIWRWVTNKDGKRTKPPYQGRAPSKHASSTNPSTWCDLNTAMLAYCEGKADGIGLVLSSGNISAFDLDHCRNVATGEIEPWAQKLIERSGSYCEVTPS